MTSKVATIIAICGIVGFIPTSAMTQSPSNSESVSTDSRNSEASKGDDSSPKDDEPSNADARGEEASEESQQDGTSNDSSQNEEANSKEASDADGSSSEQGPAGREIRSDYPGTDDSKKSQMETDRIEGLQFDQKGKPGQAYDLQIKELETKIDDLKEQVFQSKSRILSLKETVLGGELSGSRAMIVHAKGLGARFKLKRAMYSLDGSRIYNESAGEDGAISENEEIKIFDGSITAGSHNIAILLEYQGTGFGLFNYMKGYKLRITSSCQFQAEKGKAKILRVSPVANGAAFSQQQEPEIQCNIEERDLSKEMDSIASSNEGEQQASGASSSSDSNTSSDRGGN